MRVGFVLPLLACAFEDLDSQGVENDPAPGIRPPAVAWSRNVAKKPIQAVLRECIVTAAGGIIAIGQAFPSHIPIAQAFVAMIDRDGDLSFAKSVGVQDSSRFEDAISGVITKNNQIVVVGLTEDISATPAEIDGLVLRLDLTGERIWLRRVGGSDPIFLSSVCETGSGSLLVVGTTSSEPPNRPLLSEAYLHLLDAAGATLWEKTIQLDGQQTLQSVVPSSDSGFFLAGSSSILESNSSAAWIVKIDASGTLQWQRSFAGGGTAKARRIVALHDDGLFFAGDSAGPESDWIDSGYVARLRASGELEWERYLSSGIQVESVYGLTLTVDQGVVVSGARYGPDELFLARLSPEGETLWNESFVPAFGRVVTNAIASNWEGGYFFAGDCLDELSHACVCKFSPDEFSQSAFLRGDCNGDLIANLTDAVRALEFLFKGESELSCLDACDSDDNGLVSLTDAVFLLSHLFRHGPVLPPPTGAPGVDLSADALECPKK